MSEPNPQDPPKETVKESTKQDSSIIPPTTKFHLFDPNNRPPKELDCFGRAYLEKDIACHGDPSIPGDTPCILKEECKIRTGVFLQGLQKSLEGEPTDGSSGRTSKPGKMSQSDLMARLPKVDGFVLDEVTDEHGGAVYYKGEKGEGKDCVYVVPLTGRKFKLYLTSRKEFDGSSHNSGWHEREFVSVDEGLALVEKIVKLNA